MNEEQLRVEFEKWVNIQKTNWVFIKEELWEAWKAAAEFGFDEGKEEGFSQRRKF